MKSALCLLPVLLLLLACGQQPSSNKSLVGSWTMGPISEPTSNAPDKFPPEAWAAQLPPGGMFTLSPDGAVIGAEGAWKEDTVHLSWTQKSARGLVLKTEIQGRYDPASDTIQGSLTQSFQLGSTPLAMSGRLIMTRVGP